MNLRPGGHDRCLIASTDTSARIRARHVVEPARGPLGPALPHARANSVSRGRALRLRNLVEMHRPLAAFCEQPNDVAELVDRERMREDPYLTIEHRQVVRHTPSGVVTIRPVGLRSGRSGRFRPARPCSDLLGSDARDASRRREDAGVAVLPPDSDARRILVEHLLDHPCAARLRGSFGLDDDPVSNVNTHLRLAPISIRLENLQRSWYMAAPPAAMSLTHPSLRAIQNLLQTSRVSAGRVRLRSALVRHMGVVPLSPTRVSDRATVREWSHLRGRSFRERPRGLLRRCVRATGGFARGEP